MSSDDGHWYDACKSGQCVNPAVCGDDGRTVAVPLTQHEAHEMLCETAENAYDDTLKNKSDWSDPAAMANAVRAVLGASPEVLAAAMGWEFSYHSNLSHEKRPMLLGPWLPREVSRGE